jgi:hypothetical protein
MDPTTGLRSMDRLLAFPVNIRLKGLSATNTLAYNGTKLIATEKIVTCAQGPML